MTHKTLLSSVIVLCSLALTVLPAGAQSRGAVPVVEGRSRHRVFYRDKWGWVGRAVSAAAIIVDGASTQTASAQCPGCVEGGYLWDGARITPGRTAERSLVGFLLSSGFSIAEFEVMRSEPRRSGWSLTAYLAQPVTDGISHGWAAAHNYSFASDCLRAVLVCK